MKNKPRLFVVESDGTGGLLHYTYQLCTALANEGLDVTLITATDYELSNLPHNFQVVKLLHLWRRFDHDAMQLRSTNVWVRRLKKTYLLFRRGIRAIRWMIAWMRLTIFLIRSKPDLIQFSKLAFSFEAFFIGFLRRQGFILSQVCHEFEEREGRSRLESLILGVGGDVYTNFSAIFFHAQENRSRFLSIYSSIPEKNTYVIPHGNSSWLLNFKATPDALPAMKKRYNLNDSDQVVLFFGLLSPSKGLDDLIEAFSLALGSCTAKLLIAGHPTKYIDLEALQMRIAELKIKDSVIFDARYIPLDEIETLMSLATVVVYPYRSSTQSGALQVAYTFGKPVIVTKVGGLPEAVEDGKCGFLIPAQDPPELSDKIVAFVNNPGLAKEMGDYSLHLSQTRFSWQSIASQINRVYDTLIDN
ncbi:MAG: glycosyltransferase family 4 protein [bacterium]|nr:glycosyltransferase family 4 protein [bacterium]